MKLKVKIITPPKARCAVGPCPTAFTTNRGTVLVIGTIPDARELPVAVMRRVGADEFVVEVPAKVLPLK